MLSNIACNDFFNLNSNHKHEIQILSVFARDPNSENNCGLVYS